MLPLSLKQLKLHYAWGLFRVFIVSSWTGKMDLCVITQPMYQTVQVKLDACVITQPMYQDVHVKMDLCVIPQPVHQAVQVKLDAYVITQPTSCVQLHNLSLVCNYTTYLLCVITQPILTSEMFMH